MTTKIQISGPITEPVAQVSDGPLDWVEEIPANHRRHLRIWLWAGALLTAFTLTVGGVTRLTESGLSMVDWAPILGAIPPLNHADWITAFDRYKEYPQFQQLRPDMTLSEFKFIFFWEYLHRMIGRFIGMVFLIPFLFFWFKGYFNRPLLRRVVFLFALGAFQGLMGWYMVKSGLQDRPEVSQYRLGAHLLTAVAIFGFCVWFANDLAVRPRKSVDTAARHWLMRWTGGLLILVLVQMFWGALVAGLNAGLLWNTFPFMNGSLLPPKGLSMHPLYLNFFENHATVQWTHRVLATAILVGAITFAIKVRRNPALGYFRNWSLAVLGLVLLQYAFGITTLLTHVKTAIGVTHQMTALVIVGVLLSLLHRAWETVPRESAETVSSELATAR